MQKEIKNKAIIFGNGPSINEINLDLLIDREDVSTLTCNRADFLLDKTDWKPDYYFSFTIHVERKTEDWVNSAINMAKNDKTTCYLHKALKTEIADANNINFADNLFEHNRHEPIPSNLFETNFYDKQLKSFCATVTLFQYCFSNNVKSIGVIGQDGYIFNPDQNHYDSRYKYESSDFEKSNKRIIKVHDVVQKHAKKNNVKIYYLTKNSIIKTHPYLEFEDFLNL